MDRMRKSSSSSCFGCSCAGGSFWLALIVAIGLVNVILSTLDLGFFQRQQQQQAVFVVNVANEKTNFVNGENLRLTSFDFSDRQRRQFTHPKNETTLIQLIGLGPNFLTVLSGCRMARWVFPWKPNPNISEEDQKYWKDCEGKYPGHKKSDPSQMLHDFTLLKENDTIYVTHSELPRFVNLITSNANSSSSPSLLTVDVVVITGQFHNTKPYPQNVVDDLTNHPHVMHWFCQNLPIYGGIHANEPNAKISPFPYGLKFDTYYKPIFLSLHKKPKKKGKQRWFVSNETVTTSSAPSIRQVARPKIMVGHLRNTTFTRAHLPSGPEVAVDEFYSQVKKHAYLLSPNGDRPECYRHYEALGLGTSPITELDPISFRHLSSKDGVIFDNHEWNVTKLQDKLNPKPMVNPSLVLQEHWMDYVDFVVSRSLTWWDFYDKQPATLEELLQKKRKNNANKKKMKNK